MDKKRRRFLKAFSSIPAYYSVTGAVGASDDGEEVYYDDIGRPMDEEPEVVRRTPGVGIQSDIGSMDADLPDGTIHSDHEWISGGAPGLGHDYSLRLVDRGGGAVDPGFNPRTFADLTFEFWWKWEEGDQIHYFWNDDDDYRDTAFRAFTFGRAQRGMMVNNPFGGEDLSTFGVPAVSDGDWHRVRVVLDAADNTLTAYVDGEQGAQAFYDGRGWAALPTFRVMGRMSFEHPSPPDLRPEPTWGNYDNYIMTRQAVHPPDEITEPDLIWYDMEEGEGSTLGNRAGEAREADPEPDFERELAEKFAPDFHYDEAEKWFPVDPREVVNDPEVPADACEEDGICGFDALNKYTKLSDSEAAPNAVVMYNVVGPIDESGRLHCVSYWRYYAFNQFASNNHFHDGEVVHMFLDIGDIDEPENAELAAVVASAHKAWFPNNEFVPELSDREPADPIGVLSELGGHASAPDIRNVRDFHRDVDLTTETNLFSRWIGRVRDFKPQMAYGLPRAHTATDLDLTISSKSFDLPRLDEELLHEDERLPSVGEDDMIERNPGFRTHGTTLIPEYRAVSDDLSYELVDASVVRSDLEDESIETNVGPDLDFLAEPTDYFTERIIEAIPIPEGTEPASLPWEDLRFDIPLLDVQDENTWDYVLETFDWDRAGASVMSSTSRTTEFNPTDRDRTRVIGEIIELGSDEFAHLDSAYSEVEEELLADEDLDIVPIGAPEREATAVLNDGESKVIPTSSGAFTYVNIEPGKATLFVGTDGYAPVVETVDIEEDKRNRAGAGEEGGLTLVKDESAVKVQGDGSEFDDEIVSVGVEEDFAGLIYGSRPPVSNFFEVFVHEGGAYTVEVEDENGIKGVFRANPEEGDDVVEIEDLRTGKSPIIEFLVEYIEDTEELVADMDIDAPGQGRGRPPESPGRSSRGNGRGPPMSASNSFVVDAPQLRGGGNSGGGGSGSGGSGRGGGSSGNRGSGGGPPEEHPGRGSGRRSGRGAEPGEGGRNSVLMRFSVMADTARRALEFAKDYRRYNANNQLDTLLNQLDSLRNFLETPAMEIEKRHQKVLSKRLETLEDKVELAKETGLQFDR